jgi:hypothetical protein
MAGLDIWKGGSGDESGDFKGEFQKIHVTYSGESRKAPAPACQIWKRPPVSSMRLFQDQVYQKGGQFIRIVRLDRYEVEFKTTTGSVKGEGTLAVLAKKEFCRLLKGMTLVVPEKPVE